MEGLPEVESRLSHTSPSHQLTKARFKLNFTESFNENTEFGILSLFFLLLLLYLESSNSQIDKENKR